MSSRPPRAARPRWARAVLVAALATALFLPAAARAQPDCTTPGEAWRIRAWRSDYVVRPNGSVGVTERLDVDFGDSRKHGFYREIAVQLERPFPVFSGDDELRYDVDVKSVVDETGEPYEIKVSREGSYRRIRIGSPDFCVTGPVTYVIHYEISRGVRGFDGYDELFWQVTGTQSPVAIERVEARVVLPPERARSRAENAPWHADCYAGPPASTSGERCEAEVVAPGTYRFASGRLEPGEGLTFAAAFPVGVVPGPTAAERAWEAFVFWGPLGIPPLALVLMLGLWYRHGKEPEMGSIVPRWDPPEEIRPGTAGALVDQRADMDDVVATVLDLAVRGHVRIREVPPKVLPDLDEDSFLGRALGALGVDRGDWEFVRRDGETRGLAAYELLVLEGIFEGRETRRMSDLKEKFYKHLPDIREALYANLVRHRLFARSPQSTRRRWLVGGIAIAVAGAALGALGILAGSPLLLPAFVLAGIVVVVFSFFMPAMTREGARVRAWIEGLEEYIRRAEKAEIEFRNAPERSPELFDRLLPYAVALDVSDLWVRQFEGILARPPDWYQGRVGVTGWSPTSFGQDLSGFRTAAASTLASAPGGSGGSGSFGGGSVGGGGGGGGAGSW